MRILIYGAGVIGSLYAVLFAEISGNKSEKTKHFYAYMKKLKEARYEIL